MKKRLLWLLIPASVLAGVVALSAQEWRRASDAWVRADGGAVVSVVDYLTTQVANSILMGPASGAAAAPTFRVPGATDFTAWNVVSPLSMGARLVCYDEMFRTLGNNVGISCAVNAAFTTTNAGGAGVTGLASHPGIFECQVTTANQGACALQSGGNGSTAGTVVKSVLLGNGVAVEEASISVPTLSSATETFDVYFAGYSDTSMNTAVPITLGNSAIYFKCVDCRTGAGTILGTARTGGSDTTCSTGVILDTSYHKYKTVVNAAATSVDFYIDGVNKCTVSSGLPSAAMNIQPALINRTAFTASTRSLDIDYYFLTIDFTTPR